MKLRHVDELIPLPADPKLYYESLGHHEGVARLGMGTQAHWRRSDGVYVVFSINKRPPLPKQAPARLLQIGIHIGNDSKTVPGDGSALEKAICGDFGVRFNPAEDRHFRTPGKKSQDSCNIFIPLESA